MKRIRLPNIRNLLKLLFQRVVIVAFLLLLQMLLVVWAVLAGEWTETWFWVTMYLLSMGTALHIISNETDPAYKMGWMSAAMCLPIVGCLFYIILGGNRLSKRIRRKMSSMQQTLAENLSQDAEMYHWLENKEPDAALQSNYLTHEAGCPGYTNTETEYFPLGDACFPRMCEEIGKAKKYIFAF